LLFTFKHLQHTRGESAAFFAPMAPKTRLRRIEPHWHPALRYVWLRFHQIDNAWRPQSFKSTYREVYGAFKETTRAQPRGCTVHQHDSPFGIGFEAILIPSHLYPDFPIRRSSRLQALLFLLFNSGMPVEKLSD